MKWNPFQYKNKSYLLAHLDPFDWYFEAPASGKRPQREYRFHVTFSMHCFTRNPVPEESFHNDLWYSGPREQRLFCFDRYELTSELPDIVRSLGDRPCWHTNHNSFFTIEITTQAGLKIDYEVYFDITRSKNNGWLNLIVQSAYVRTAQYQSQRPRKRKIRLDVIAYKRQLGQQIKPGQ